MSTSPMSLPKYPIVLVFGGRDYQGIHPLWSVLDKLHGDGGIGEIIHGDARGADRLGARWAEARRVPMRAFPADWETHGKAAGMLRNQSMLRERPCLGVMCPGGRGTEDMHRRLQYAKIPVVRVAPVPLPKDPSEWPDKALQVFRAELAELRGDEVPDDVAVRFALHTVRSNWPLIYSGVYPLCSTL